MFLWTLVVAILVSTQPLRAEKSGKKGRPNERARVTCKEATPLARSSMIEVEVSPGVIHRMATPGLSDLFFTTDPDSRFGPGVGMWKGAAWQLARRFKCWRGKKEVPAIDPVGATTLADVGEAVAKQFWNDRARTFEGVEEALVAAGDGCAHERFELLRILAGGGVVEEDESTWAPVRAVWKCDRALAQKQGLAPK